MSPPIDPAWAPGGPVLVPGGAGYIGSHCVRQLQRAGVEVHVLDNLSTGHRQAVDAPLHVCDLADKEALDRVFAEVSPVGVIHFAAKCYVGESVQDPSKYYRENVFNTWNLLEAMRAADCRDIVFSSTCATYGEPVTIPMTEEHPQVPINPYGRTKLHMEHMLQDFGRAYGMRHAALRYFNAAGASPDGDIGEDHAPETHLIPLILRFALGRGAPIRILGDDYDTRDGTCVRDYIHIDDLSDAHLRALHLLQEGREELVCNLGTGTGYTVKEMIAAAREVTGHDLPAEVVPRRQGDPAQLVSGGTRARDVLGWEPARSSIETILRDAWAFHRAHPDGFVGA